VVGWALGNCWPFPSGVHCITSFFFTTNLVPRWISVWGLVFGITGIVSCALVSTGLIAPAGTVQVIMVMPMLPQELVLAVWLIVKGFNPSVISARAGNIGLHAEGED